MDTLEERLLGMIKHNADSVGKLCDNLLALIAVVDDVSDEIHRLNERITELEKYQWKS